jgi:hypothetical protein
MKKIKINFGNLKLGSTLLYLCMILISSLIIVVGLISLPLTEKIKEDISYNLITKESSYWRKIYALELDTSDATEADKRKYIEETKDILYRRLNKAGLEEVSIYEENTDDSNILKVDVKTSEDESFVDNLIENRYFVTVVTRKDDVDFDSEDNQYAYLFTENYDSTEFTGSSFRNILITKLKNSSGEYSYFAVFKPWITKEKAFQNFLKQYEEEYIGVSIDGFVTPYYVPTSDPKTFAVSLSGEAAQAELIDILYNSGEIPLSFTTGDTEYVDVPSSSFNYIYLSTAILGSVILSYAILLFVIKENSKTISLSLFSTLMTFAGWITYLKVTSTPVDTWLLALECILAAILIYVLTHNRESQVPITVSLALSFFILMLFGIGYMKIFGKEMLLVLILCQFNIVFGKWYLNNMKKVMIK